METRIKGFERVVEKVGFETHFHDGEVLTLELSRMREKPVLNITILTNRSFRPSEHPCTESDYYVVRLAFRGVDDVDLDNFNHQNVLQCLVETQLGDRLKIWFAGTFGLDCSFTCDEGEVLSVEPSQMKCGEPFTRV